MDFLNVINDCTPDARSSGIRPKRFTKIFKNFVKAGNHTKISPQVVFVPVETVPVVQRRVVQRRVVQQQVAQQQSVDAAPVAQRLRRSTRLAQKPRVSYKMFY